jgi:hypothetical protein
MNSVMPLLLAHTGAVLRDLLDLLLGWSLEPGLQAKDRWVWGKGLFSVMAQA